MKPAIRVENLSKRYHIGRAPTGFSNLTETVRTVARSTWGKLKQLAAAGEATDGTAYWALKDVSFDVHPGEVVGVVGRNGAGKSTLLKLMSRITVPTSGRIEVRGRMGSLLEVGTGFHPELTGRENVFLNGSILGMTRQEIRAKFDKIVEFSEIGAYLDTPVKRYSSGMYVRLAFAVAAHLEPEILIVDEVLAVGDATFQRRCIDRMAELAAQGRTILFVSHNMQLIPRFCHRAVYLERGTVKQVGPADKVTQLYLDKLLEDSRTGDLRDKQRIGDGRAKFVRVGLLDGTGRALSVHTSGDDMTVRVDIETQHAIPDVTVAVSVQSLHGTRVISGSTRDTGFAASLTPGTQTFECRFDKVHIRPGQTVLVNLALTTEAGIVIDEVEAGAVLDVIGDERHVRLSTNTDQGVWVCPQEWAKI
ncbi:ABC transporter ATP-binding protein [Fimbriiglobus ruber]|uniref:Teichoic acid export ATP-binding protein TagH n=1 Tax=Fimbriiglobus ruber TaxID=1908690 RepID=A0A225DQP2_9BACT|nr:ABC transporter ATP-binding protein [Fimbriiglobus ruber]OWK43712.1 Teichoic acid export ATP-binding protein TagH [Fimbriiglobus ruber]